jgi:HEAT repeat protein
VISRRFWYPVTGLAVTVGIVAGMWWWQPDASQPRQGGQPAPKKDDAPAAHGAADASPAEEAAPFKLEQAATLSTADVALQLAAWPEGKRTGELPAFARLLADRGPAAVKDIASALATAETNSARGVLADSLALIGSADAVQELCAAATAAQPGPPRGSIADAFRALGNPAAVPVLATVFSQTDDPQLTTEAGSAIRRLADAPAVLALAELMVEDGQLHSQREALLEVLAGLQSPAARPALEALAADESDPQRAIAARKALAAKR